MPKARKGHRSSMVVVSGKESRAMRVGASGSDSNSRSPTKSHFPPRIYHHRHRPHIASTSCSSSWYCRGRDADHIGSWRKEVSPLSTNIQNADTHTQHQRTSSRSIRTLKIASPPPFPFPFNQRISLRALGLTRTSFSQRASSFELDVAKGSTGPFRALSLTWRGISPSQHRDSSKDRQKTIQRRAGYLLC